MILFSGLSPQGSAHGRSQEFGFEAALKQKLPINNVVVMFQLMQTSLNVPQKFKMTSAYFGSGDGFLSARG